MDTETGFYEGCIVKDRTGTTLMNELDILWMYVNGASNFMSEDDELNHPQVAQELEDRWNKSIARPSSGNKNMHHRKTALWK